MVESNSIVTDTVSTSVVQNSEIANQVLQQQKTQAANIQQKDMMANTNSKAYNKEAQTTLNFCTLLDDKEQSCKNGTDLENIKAVKNGIKQLIDSQVIKSDKQLQQYFLEIKQKTALLDSIAQNLVVEDQNESRLHQDCLKVVQDAISALREKYQYQLPTIQYDLLAESIIAPDDDDDKVVQQLVQKYQESIDALYETEGKSIAQLVSKNVNTIKQKILTQSNSASETQKEETKLNYECLKDAKDAADKNIDYLESQLNEYFKKCKADITAVIVRTENVVRILKSDLIQQDKMRPFSFGFWTPKPKKQKIVQCLKVTIHRVLLILNENYENVRVDYPGWKDVKQAPEDIRKFREFLTSHFGIEDTYITQLNNPTKRMLTSCMKKIKSYFITTAKSPDTKLCLWTYYAGHGVMNNMTYAVLNE